jgi:hypothetical protein
MTPDPENPTAAPAPEATPVAPAASAPAEPVAAPELASGADQPAPASESPPSDAGAAPQEAAPSLLEKFVSEQKDKAEEKAAEAKEVDKPADPAAAKPGEEKPADDAEVKSEEAKPELPKVEYKYELPESIKMDDTQREQFHQALDAFRSDPEKGAQNLLGMAETMMANYAEHLGREQWRVFNETRSNWLKEVMADPVLGGAGHDTAMGAIARMRDKFASQAKQGSPEYEADMKAFDTFLRVTGAGDNIHFLRLLHNVARKFDEPPMPPPGARPVPENGRRPGESRSQRMYPSMQNEQP